MGGNNEMVEDNNDEGMEKQDCSGKISKKKEHKNQTKEENITKSYSAQPATTRRPLSLARMGDHDAAQKRSSMISLASITSTPQHLGTNSWLSALDVSKAENLDSSPVSLSSQQQQHQGKKSRIPVLRSSSCRVPRNLSFGAGVQRTFVRPKSKHWHQRSEPMDTGVDLEKVDFGSLRNALPD